MSCVFIANSGSPGKPGLETIERREAFSGKNLAQFHKSLRMCRDFLLTLMSKQCTPPWCCSLDSWRRSGLCWALCCQGNKQAHTAYTSVFDLSLHPRPAWVKAMSSCGNLFPAAGILEDLVDKTHGQTYTVMETILKPEGKEIHKC